LTAILSCATLPCLAVAEASSPYHAAFNHTLVEAADSGDIAALRRLLRQGNPADSRAQFGITALMRAAYHGYGDMVELLLESGADPSAVDMGGITALHIAARNGKIRVVQQLLKAGVHPDLADDHGWTPLMRATMQKHAETVRFLLESGAKIEKENRWNQSALDIAAQFGDTETVQAFQPFLTWRNTSSEQTVRLLGYARRNKNRAIHPLLSDMLDKIQHQPAKTESQPTESESIKPLPQESDAPMAMPIAPLHNEPSHRSHDSHDAATTSVTASVPPVPSKLAIPEKEAIPDTAMTQVHPVPVEPLAVPPAGAVAVRHPSAYPLAFRQKMIASQGANGVLASSVIAPAQVPMTASEAPVVAEQAPVAMSDPTALPVPVVDDEPHLSMVTVKQEKLPLQSRKRTKIEDGETGMRRHGRAQSGVNARLSDNKTAEASLGGHVPDVTVDAQWASSIPSFSGGVEGSRSENVPEIDILRPAKVAPNEAVEIKDLDQPDSSSAVTVSPARKISVSSSTVSAAAPIVTKSASTTVALGETSSVTKPQTGTVQIVSDSVSRWMGSIPVSDELSHYTPPPSHTVTPLWIHVQSYPSDRSAVGLKKFLDSESWAVPYRLLAVEEEGRMVSLRVGPFYTVDNIVSSCGWIRDFLQSRREGTCTIEYRRRNGEFVNPKQVGP
jgi:hypothetical protein